MGGAGIIENGVLTAEEKTALEGIGQIVELARPATRRWEGIGAEGIGIDGSVGVQHLGRLAYRIAPDIT